MRDAPTRRRLVERIGALRPDAPRRWGTMTAHQAVCHLTDSFRGCMGEKSVSQAPSLLPRRLMKFGALYMPIPWPHGVPTRPEMDQAIGGTAPVEFENDRAELIKVMERFVHAGKWTPHPMFGAMPEKDWMRWGYLHTDHHLRQFGA
jgi:hypothetical protein